MFETKAIFEQNYLTNGILLFSLQLIVYPHSEVVLKSIIKTVLYKNCSQNKYFCIKKKLKEKWFYNIQFLIG